MPNAKILGTGSYLPKKKITNIELFEKISNFDVKKARYSLQKKGVAIEALNDSEIFDCWVKQVCGVTQRFNFSEADETPFEGSNKNLEAMAYHASLAAIEEAGIDKEEIDAVLFASFTSDCLIPNSAVVLSLKLELKNPSAITSNTACCGFLDVLGDGFIKIKAGMHKTVLVVAAEQFSNRLNFCDPTTAILFGDGAGAAVLQAAEEEAVGAYYSGSSYSENITMTYGESLAMGGGPLVQKKAVHTMAQAAHKAMALAGTSIDQYDYVLPHQANLRILKELAHKMKIDEEKVITAIDIIANISCATVPVALDLFRKGKLKQKPKKKSDVRYLSTAVGGGYCYASVPFTL